MEILSWLVTIAAVICWILTLVEMFKRAGVLHGILGIICGLWAFIWGWMNVGQTGQKNIMIAWSAIIVLNIIVTMLSMGSAAAG